MIPTDVDSAFVSVDIETAGPIPGRYSMLSLGACLAADPDSSCYFEFVPQSTDFIASALAVSGLSMDQLTESGLPLEEGMQQFADWLAAVIPANEAPVFVAFNAPFDWSFVNYSFHQTLGYNPFGHAALDIKALSMGILGFNWSEASFHVLANRFLDRTELRHHALNDAQDQAVIFQKLLHLSRQQQQQIPPVATQSKEKD